METDISKKKRKKSMAKMGNRAGHIQEETNIGDDEKQKKLYEAAGAGHHSELEEILDNMKKQISQEELEETVLSVLVELKLNNIALTDEVELTLHEYIWKRCFFTKRSYKINEIKTNIKLLDFIVDYAIFFDDVQDILIFSLKSIVKHVHLLKTHLGRTYSLLPWNEIEFYIHCYITLSTEQSDLNVFNSIILNKTDLIAYLQQFMRSLKKLPIEDLTDVTLELPDRPREEIVQEIIKSCPVFDKLYSDVGYIRDLYCLHKISKYGNILKSISPQERDADKLIIRALYVVSELLKHTLDTPNLSPMRSDLILLSISDNCREAILALRNAVSPEDAFICRRTLIEASDSNFFNTVYRDIIHIGQITEDLFFREFIKLFLKNSSKMKETPDILKMIDDFSSIFLFAKKKFHTSKDSGLPFLSNTEKIAKVLKKLSTELENKDHRYEELKKIANDCQRSQGYEWKNTLEYLIKSEDFISYYKPGVSNEVVRALLDILLSIQKDNDANAYNNEMASLITEIMVLLEFEIGDDNDLKQKLKDTYSVMHKMFILHQKKGQWNFRKSETSVEDVLTNYKNSFKKVKDKNYESYKSLKPKSMEIMKAHAFDIISWLQIQNRLEHLTGNLSMLLDHLKNDYDWNDLIFNSMTVIFHIAKNHELLMEMNFDKKQTTTFNTSFIYQTVTISKKIKAFYKFDDFEQFERVLAKGADIRVRDTENSNYLHYAVEKYNIDQMKLLHKEGALYCKNLKLQTPLHVAAEKGKAEIVSHFVDGTNQILHYQDIFGRSPLHVAVLRRHRDIVEILVEAGSDPFLKDYLDISPALYAVLDGNKEILVVLLSNEEKGNETKKNEYKFLFQTAVDSNQYEIVEFLLSENFIVLEDEYGKTVMTAAVSNGHIRLVEIFLGCDMCPRNCILTAVQKNFEIIVEKILENWAEEANASNPENGMTALHFAAINGNDYLIDLLFRNGAKIETRDLEGNIPLHVAVKNGKIEAVKMLLEIAGDSEVNSTMNNRRYTPLHIAAESGFYEISQLLLDHWVTLESEDFSVSPLVLAYYNQHKDIFELIRNNLDFRSKRKNRDKIKPTKINKSGTIPITTSILQNASIIIRNVDQDVLQCSYDEIVMKIIDQNNFEKKIKSNVKVLRIDTEKGTIILNLLKNSIYEQFKNKKNLKIGWEECCPIKDYFYIFRCYKCAGFGHDEVDCTSEQICTRCSESHHINNCRNTKFKCYHCSGKNQSLGLNLDVKHSPLDQFCHWYRKLLRDKYEKQLKTRK